MSVIEMISAYGEHLAFSADDGRQVTRRDKCRYWNLAPEKSHSN